MLYVTTRNKSDVYTAYHALQKNRCEDGGLYVPFQLPHFSKEEIDALRDKSFGQCVAEVLNLFFSARLDGWDVDFCVGRYPAKLVSMSHKILVAETWHNPDWEFARMVRNLTGRIRGTEDTNNTPTSWAWIAIRIAVLFGLFSDAQRLGVASSDKPIDVAVATGDFTAPMAVWYARQMGLPVGKIICGSNDNGTLWDLIHHGQLHTEGEAPSDLERLIFSALGWEETQRYCEACVKGRIYTPAEEQLEKLSAGLFAGVVSHKRVESVICNVYSAGTYLLDPSSALAYGALQDYRASTGEGRTALILTERSPVRSAEAVANTLGISQQELKDRIGMT